ncbi:MAG: protein kinase, partial [Planctomycetales bacterium]|nr:protein kinase [Planctomycetales bacterium]
HRDLKPSNILIDASGRVRITDFGLAKRVEGESDLTFTGQVLGTPSYMSPEQAAAQHAIIGPPTDIYALGAILYELVTGRPPFRSESIGEILRQVQHDEPVRPRLLNPKLPRDLETSCLKCLEKEPRRRYGTAKLLADDLGRYLGGEPILARPLSSPARAWRWCKRKPLVAAMSAAIAGLAILIVVLSSLLAIYQGQRRTVAESHERETKVLLGQKSKLAGELKTALHRSMLGTMHVQLQRVGDILPQDPPLARLLLLDESKCPPDLRDFAWGHYSHLANRERATLHGTATLASNAEVLALVTTAGALELWATSPLNHLATVPPSEDGLWRVLAISKDSRSLAATSTGTDLFLVDVRTGFVSKWKDSLPAPAIRGSFSHDSQLLAVLSPSNIHVLELDNPFHAPWLAFQGVGFEHIQFAEDGCFFATETKSGTVVVVNVYSQDLKLLNLGGAVSTISAETGTIAHVDGNLELGLRFWEDGFANRIAVAGHGSGSSAVFSNDGSLLSLADHERLGTLIATQFELIRPGQPSPVFQRSDIDGRRRGAARAIALPPHNRFLVACRGNGQIELMTIPDGMQPAPNPPSIV